RLRASWGLCERLEGKICAMDGWAMARRPMNGKNGNGNGNGVERWRGQVDEKLANIAADLAEMKGTDAATQNAAQAAIREMGAALTAAIKEADRCGQTAHEAFERRNEEFDRRIVTLEIAHNYAKAKVALFAGIAGILGGGIASALSNFIIKKLVG